MSISEGLRTSLNQIRETSIENNTLYHKQIDEITPDTDISALSGALLNDANLMNEFFNTLVKRIMYTQIVDFKLYKNPLKFLEGERMPLGHIGQEIFINPAEGREFNANDFAGLLAKYEVDVKVQYPYVNSDKQYPVTLTRQKLRDAFVSWSSLESFIDAISQSLYNGAYIDRYNFTKGLVASAYNQNAVQIETLAEPNTEALAKQFLTKARSIYLKMQDASPDFNAWRKVGGYGRDVMTWTEAEDIVFLIRADIGAYLDVNVLAQTFNLDKAVLLGRVKYVSDFTQRNSKGKVVIDGSNILGIIADKAWFKIKNQDTAMDEFYNANNRSIQLYLNDVNMYQFSLFANAVVFATAEPEVAITSMKFAETSLSLKIDETKSIRISTTPTAANTPDIEFTSGTPANATVKTTSDKEIEITGVKAGTSIITARAGTLTTTVNVTVTE